MENEIWKDIEGYEGLYQVSDRGRVRSLKKILNQTIQKDGYYNVTLHKNKDKKTFRVHRLVAQAFIPNPDNKSEVNHINEDKTDNRACNLNWMSHKENANWGTGLERTHQKCCKQVKQMTLDGQIITIWPSISEAGKNGFNQCNISLCCNGIKKTHKGYLWAFV